MAGSEQYPPTLVSVPTGGQAGRGNGLVECARASLQWRGTAAALEGEKSCSDVGALLLVIGQFMLYADTGKGRRPTWQAAAPGPVTEPLVDAVVSSLRGLGARVQTGIFGAEMKVSLINDGPVTIIVEL